MDKKELENLIVGLINKSVETVGEVSVVEEGGEDRPRTTWFSVEAKYPHVYLDRNGEALFALNYIARKLIETKVYPLLNKEENQTPPRFNDILIDINGFQKNKIENIHTTVHMMAERARHFKSNVEIDPMSAFDRRIVHEFLSSATDLETESEGTGPYRRVVIKYVGEN